MIEINRSALVPFSTRIMFDLVYDVASYPEFLPWCGAASVLKSSAGHQVARVNIRKGPVNTHFTTRNTLKDAESIKLQLVEGPFRQLEGEWAFKALSDDACKVELQLRFDFAIGPVGLLLQPVFNQIADTLVSAFVQRAGSLHLSSGT